MKSHVEEEGVTRFWLSWERNYQVALGERTQESTRRRRLAVGILTSEVQVLGWSHRYFKRGRTY